MRCSSRWAKRSTTAASSTPRRAPRCAAPMAGWPRSKRPLRVRATRSSELPRGGAGGEIDRGAENVGVGLDAVHDDGDALRVVGEAAELRADVDDALAE